MAWDLPLDSRRLEVLERPCVGVRPLVRLLLGDAGLRVEVGDPLPGETALYHRVERLAIQAVVDGTLPAADAGGVLGGILEPPVYTAWFPADDAEGRASPWGALKLSDAMPATRPREFLAWWRRAGLPALPGAPVDRLPSDDAGVGQAELSSGAAEKAAVQAIMQEVWKMDPTLTQVAVASHDKVQMMVVGSVARRTLRSWAKEVDPRPPTQRKPGPRPKRPSDSGPGGG